MSDASVTPADPTAKKPSAPWKGVVRLAVAVALIALLFKLVSWRDHLTWPAEFGEAPLVGEVTAAADGGLERFVVTDGKWAGTSLEFVPAEAGSEATWAAVVVRKPGEEPRRLELAAADRAALDNQPEVGLRTALIRLARAPLALTQALLLYVVGAMLSFQRWQVLLRAVGVEANFWRVQKLGFFGLFFSNIIPGMTGGDLVKAIMVARDHPEQKPAAVLSVIVDRAIGLLGLAVVASAALAFQHGRFPATEFKLNVILGLIVAGAAVVMSRRLRRAIRLDKLLAALPFAELLKKLDRAALLYRDAGWQVAYSVVASFAVHGMILWSFCVLGGALGIKISALDYFSLAPLALIAQSLPLTPGGVGVGEAAFMYFFAPAGVARASAIALSVSYRLVQLLVSLVGGVLLLVKHEPPVSKAEMEGGPAGERKDGGRDDRGDPSAAA
ncbi:MAG: flippase-like domain-containing protein [Planctomycetes bacterium]|nr:flippase-like domain-containing protein [Planctomycetota bacterium]